MSIRERLSGIWLISMTLLSLFALTVFYVAQMWMDILVIRMAYLALAALQVTTLVIYLWGPEKLSFRPLPVPCRDPGPDRRLRDGRGGAPPGGAYPGV